MLFLVFLLLLSVILTNKGIITDHCLTFAISCAKEDYSVSLIQLTRIWYFQDLLWNILKVCNNRSIRLEHIRTAFPSSYGLNIIFHYVVFHKQFSLSSYHSVRYQDADGTGCLFVDSTSLSINAGVCRRRLLSVTVDVDLAGENLD